MTNSEFEQWFKEQWESVVKMLKGYDLSQIYIMPNHSKMYP